MKVKNFKVKLVSRKTITKFVETWHYSKSINGVRASFCFGLYNDDKLIGAMIYGKLGMANAWKKYGDSEDDVIELRRLCCVDDTPKNTESYFIGKTIKWLENNTEIKNIVSYADCNQGHEGVIYKASNFSFEGKTSAGKVIIRKSDGRQYHDKAIRSKYKGKLKPFAQKLKDQLENDEAYYVNTVGKNIYLYKLKTKFKNRSYIYKVTSPSGKIYIGASNNPKRRWNQHCSDKTSALYPVAQKYGRENLTWEIIFSHLNSEVVYEKEIEYIIKFDSYSNGYNRTRGGDRAGGNFILTDSQVKYIVTLLKEEELTISEIAKIFIVSDTTIRDIKSGKTWSNVTGLINGLTRSKKVAKGENQGNSILTAEIVRNVKIDYMKPLTISGLSEKYTIKKSTIESILHERNWKHIIVDGFVYNKEKRNANLNKEIVLSIRSDYDTGMKITELSKKYNVNRNSVSKIVRKITWVGI